MAERTETSREPEQVESRCPEAGQLRGFHPGGEQVQPHRPRIESVLYLQSGIVSVQGRRPKIPRIAWVLYLQSGAAQLETYRVGFPREWDRRGVSGLSLRPWDLLWRIRH